MCRFFRFHRLVLPLRRHSRERALRDFACRLGPSSWPLFKCAGRFSVQRAANFLRDGDAIHFRLGHLSFDLRRKLVTSRRPPSAASAVADGGQDAESSVADSMLSAASIKIPSGPRGSYTAACSDVRGMDAADDDECEKDELHVEVSRVACRL